ncbi:MerR family transcriptional regulator [Rosenbergiella epipactidis]|uniref:MerR family transcriptional regulator n=1 Tax=Rosenbergiella epipactidis TaxID=1544694 RepID=UPI001F4F4CC9|nr:hypothetical protein [Rosenbergiella epipactidis]
MTLVSISEAARMTGKARSTLHKYIKQGKLSTTTDSDNSKKIEISELLRVFGPLLGVASDTVTTVAKQQQTTQVNTDKLHARIQLLEQENSHLKDTNSLLEKNLDDVRQAMYLIESKLPKTPEPAPEPQPKATTPVVTETVTPVTTKKPWQFWRK